MQTAEKQKSALRKNRSQEVGKTDPNKTEGNNTEMNETDPSIPLPSSPPTSQQKMKADQRLCGADGGEQLQQTGISAHQRHFGAMIPPAYKA